MNDEKRPSKAVRSQVGRMTIQADVVVVGAGGGGAVLGLALAQRGVPALVIEQASGPPGGLRGEILQPNGQQVLGRLGLLPKLPPDSVRPVSRFHFCRVGGERLCTIDYRLLPPPYNHALVSLPNAAHHVILRACEDQAPGRLWYGTRFRRLIREGGRLVAVEAERNGTAVTIPCRVVVGADGALSRVREALDIPAALHLYPEGYLVALLDDAEGTEEARYFVGRRTILGVFPAASGKLYVFYMIRAGSMDRLKAAGLDALKASLVSVDPRLGRSLEHLKDWSQTAYMPTGRVRAKTWVVDGAALIGDAAHAMNPHASQGRMQAMVDAMTLADVLRDCLEGNDVSAGALAAFERARRPQVNMLQRLADEQVLFWNTGNPVLGWLRTRVFRTLDRNARLRYRVLATTAGLRATRPFGWWDRLMAAGFLPDPWADRLPPEAGEAAGKADT